MKKIISFILLIAVATQLRCQQPTWKDLSYATVSQSQKLDIYIPQKGFGPFPVIIVIHGGGWQAGDKAGGVIQPMLEGLGHGYAVVSINYRLSDEAHGLQLLHDVKAAIRWIRANAAKYKLNASKIALWGDSAGGHLCALAGTTSGVGGVTEDFTLGNPKQSSKVQAVVDWFGPTDLLAMDDQYNILDQNGAKHSTATSPESKVIGQPILQAAKLVRAFNPVSYISTDDPPFFIEHGTKDMTVPYLQSTVFAESLSKAIGADKVHLRLLEGAAHEDAAFRDAGNLDLIFAFLDKYVKN